MCRCGLENLERDLNLEAEKEKGTEFLFISFPSRCGGAAGAVGMLKRAASLSSVFPGSIACPAEFLASFGVCSSIRVVIDSFMVVLHLVFSFTRVNVFLFIDLASLYYERGETSAKR